MTTGTTAADEETPSETLIGAFAVGDGDSLVFYKNRTTTDQADRAGIGARQLDCPPFGKRDHAGRSRMASSYPLGVGRSMTRPMQAEAGTICLRLLSPA